MATGISINNFGDLKDGYLNLVEESDGLTIQFKQMLANSKDTVAKFVKVAILDQFNQKIFDASGKPIEVVAEYLTNPNNPDMKATFTASQLASLKDGSGYKLAFYFGSGSSSSSATWSSVGIITNANKTDPANLSFNVDTQLQGLNTATDFINNKYFIHSDANYLVKGVFQASTIDADVVQIKLSIAGYADKIISNNGQSLTGFSINLMDNKDGYNFGYNQDGTIKATLTDRAGNVKDVIYNFHIQDAAAAPTELKIISEVSNNYLNENQAKDGLALQLELIGNQVDAYGLKANAFNKVLIDVYDSNGMKLTTVQSPVMTSDGQVYRLDTSILKDFLAGVQDGTYTLKYSVSNGQVTQYLSSNDSQFTLDRVVNGPDFSENTKINDHFYVQSDGALKGMVAADVTELKINGVTVAVDADHRFSVKPSDLGLVPGEKTVSFLITDAAGNQKPGSVDLYWQPESQKPQVMAVDGGSVNDGYLNFSEKANDPVLQVKVEAFQNDPVYGPSAHPYQFVRVEISNAQGVVLGQNFDMSDSSVGAKLEGGVYTFDAKLMGALPDGQYRVHVYANNTGKDVSDWGDPVSAQYPDGSALSQGVGAFTVDTQIADPTDLNAQVKDKYYISSEDENPATKGIFSGHVDSDVTQVQIGVKDAQGNINYQNADLNNGRFSMDVVSKLALDTGSDGQLFVNLMDVAGNTKPLVYDYHVQGVAQTPNDIQVVNQSIGDDQYLNATEGENGVSIVVQYSDYQADGDYGPLANLYSQIQVTLIKPDATSISRPIDFHDATELQSLFGASEFESDGDYRFEFAASKDGVNWTSVLKQSAFVVDKTIVDAGVGNKEVQASPQVFMISSEKGEAKGQLMVHVDSNDVTHIKIWDHDTVVTKGTDDYKIDLGLNPGETRILDVQLTDRAGNVKEQSVTVFVQDDSSIPVVNMTGSTALQDSYLNKAEMTNGWSLNASFEAYQINRTYNTESANPFTHFRIEVRDATGVVNWRDFDLSSMNGPLFNLQNYGFTAVELQQATMPSGADSPAGGGSSGMTSGADSLAAETPTGSDSLTAAAATGSDAPAATMAISDTSAETPTGSDSLTAAAATGSDALAATMAISDTSSYTAVAVPMAAGDTSTQGFALADGSYTIKLYASNDGVIWKAADGSWTGQVQVDTQVQAAQSTNTLKLDHYMISSQTGDSAAGKFMVNLAGQTDIQTVEVTLKDAQNYKPMVLSGTGGVYKIDVSQLGLTPGQDAELTVRLTDMAGNSITSDMSVHVQAKASAPAAIQMVSNVSDAYLNAQEALVNVGSLTYLSSTQDGSYGPAADQYGKVSLKVFNGSVLMKSYDYTVSGDVSGNHAAPATVFSDLALQEGGQYSLQYTISNGYDAVSASRLFTVDRSIDPATIDQAYRFDNHTTTPSDDFWALKLGMISGTFDSRDLQSVGFKVDGNAVAATINNNTWALDKSMFGLDGTHDLTIETMDKAGNINISSFSVLNDTQTTLPVVTSAAIQTLSNGQEAIGAIKGTAEAYAKIEMYSIDPTTGLKTTAVSTVSYADANGAWSITPLNSNGTAITQQPSGVNLQLQISSMDDYGNLAVQTSTIILADSVDASNQSYASSNANYIIYGFGGGDKFTTGSSGDWLFGGIGDDLLTSGSGNDFLQGGAGKDTMNGGGGSDTFSYTAATDSVFGFKQQGKNVVADYSKSDVIQSFSKAAVDGDKIDLNQLLKSIGATGQFVKGLDANGNLTLDGNGSGATSNIGSFWLGKDSYLYGNLSGNEKADFAVSLTTNDAGAAFTGDALKDLVKYLDPNDPLNVNNLHLIF